MAQLKNTIILGDLSVTGAAHLAKVYTNILNAPTTSNGTTFGLGSDGQVLTSNGTQIYWGHSLNATINAGTASKIAYYSGANAISAGSITTDGSYLSSVNYLTINHAHQTDYRFYVNGTTYLGGQTYINCSSNNLPSLRWNKGGTNWGGIGYHNVSNENFFGPVNSSGAWTNTNTDTWTFSGYLRQELPEINNTAFTNSLVLKANQSNQSSQESFTATNSSWGITFIRQWNSGDQNASSAGIYAVGSGSWRTGLVFRTKNNSTGSGGTHDINALWLSPAGHATVAGGLGVLNSANNTGLGLSLYGGAATGQPTYGIMFAGTATFGKMGNVSGDWATYFTMSNTDNRGWIFKRNTSTNGNVASISAMGTYSTSVTTSTHINGLNGTQVAVNMTAAAGYNMLARIKSTSGRFNIGVYNKGMTVVYGADTVTTNTYTYAIGLLNEAGETWLKRLYVNNDGQVNGNSPTWHQSAYIESTGNIYTTGRYFADGTSTGQGFDLHGSAIEYGRWWVQTKGKAPTATTTNGTTTYSGAARGEVYLYVGNSRVFGNNANGVNDNARGRIHVYGDGTGYTRIMHGEWYGANLTVIAGTNSTANTAHYSYIIVGNNGNVSTTTAHTEGRLRLYSAATHYHELAGTSTTTHYTHTLPNQTGVLVQSTAQMTVSQGGAENTLAYYSATNTISGASSIYTDGKFLNIGDTVRLSTSWGGTNRNTLVVGQNGVDKIVAGNLQSTIKGAVIGAHNSALSAWAPLYVAGKPLYFYLEQVKVAQIVDGCLSLFPTTGSYREGLRIHSYSSWSDITLCGNDNTADSGTSANSWFIGNNNGNFYISRNGSSSSTTGYIANTDSGYWHLYNKVGINGKNTSYTLYVNGNTLNNGIVYFANGTTYYINNSAVGYLNDLRVDNTRLVDNWLGFYSAVNAGGKRLGYVQGAAARMYFRIENGQDSFDFNGTIRPSSAAAGNLGAGAGYEWGTVFSRNFSLYRNSAWYGDFYIGTVGTANSGDGNTTVGTAGIVYLRLGNGTARPASGTAGGANNAYGIIRIYNIDTAYCDLQCNQWSSYGQLALNGTVRGTYRGLLSWPSSTGLTFMSNGTDQGLYSEGKRWVIYHNVSNNRVGIGNSTVSGGLDIQLNGNTYLAGRLDIRPGSAAPPLNIQTAAGTWSYIRLHNGAQLWDIATNSNAAGTAPANSLGFRYGGANPTATAGVWITPAQVLMGAAWNDYAEYRKSAAKEPGRVIKETPTGEMKLTTQRLEKGCEIISDTYGFTIGDAHEGNVPTAATGRVLAYTDEPIETFELGMPVCSGPNGTVSQMTEEEARMYPWCIIGTVSEIPSYNEWGPENNRVKVNGRIWVRIR